MKKTILISAILFSFNGWAHYEIFPSCLKDNNQHRNYEAHDALQDNIQQHKLIKKAVHYV